MAADRQAVRAMQERLAQRLQDAHSENYDMAAWLAVRSASAAYLLPLSQAGEVFPWGGVQRVPYTKPWFAGIANVRGSLAGVVDLAALLGHPVPRSEAALAACSLVAFNPALELNTALLVDDLQGLRATTAWATSEAPPADAPAFFGPVYVDAQGARWQELQLQLLAQSADFLDIRAAPVG